MAGTNTNSTTRHTGVPIKKGFFYKYQTFSDQLVMIKLFKDGILEYNNQDPK